MRELKFRVYTVWNAYIYSDEFDSLIAFFGYVENHRGIVEQFIGIHDEEGREIYEGDIVEWQNVTGYEDGFAAVEWIDDQCMIKLVNDAANIYDTIWDFDELRVIGNIHEGRLGTN
jgi:uncharacterized phage protein (TIGR01671 family)